MDTTPAQDTTTDTAGTAAEAPKPSDLAPARESETDWKAEARKWEARSKANAAAAKQLEALNEQVRARDADIESLRAKVTAFEHERELAAWKEQVSSDTGVPANLLRGDTLEDLQAHAADIKAALEEHSKSRPRGPVVPMAGKVPDVQSSPMKDLAGALFGQS